MGNAEVCCSCKDGSEEGQGPVIVKTMPVIDKQQKEPEQIGEDKTKPENRTSQAQEPVPDTYEFTIKLKRSSVSEPWGFGMKTTGLSKTPAEQQLLVMNPGGKCLEEWEKANPNLKVQSLDEMVQVNGVRGVEKIVSMLKVSVEVAITLRRQLRIHVKVTKKSGDNLGAKLKRGTLEVEEVVDGPVGTYNKGCLRSQQISIGDQLIGINGKTMDAKDLLTELATTRDGADVTLTFGRKGAPSSGTDYGIP